VTMQKSTRVVGEEEKEREGGNMEKPGETRPGLTLWEESE